MDFPLLVRICKVLGSNSEVSPAQYIVLHCRGGIFCGLLLFIYRKRSFACTRWDGGWNSGYKLQTKPSSMLLLYRSLNFEAVKSVDLLVIDTLPSLHTVHILETKCKLD